MTHEDQHGAAQESKASPSEGAGQDAGQSAQESVRENSRGSAEGRVRTVGILGAGRVGAALARQALKSGFAVRIATAKPAEDIALLVDIVTPGAQATTAADAAASDLVVIAVPLHKYRTLDPALLAGRTVIDAMNYWAPIDGEIQDFEADARTSSEIVHSHLAQSDLVKTLNHIGYHDLEEQGQEPGTVGRRALAFAGGSDAAKTAVAGFINGLGYDPVNAGPLEAGRIFQPGTPIFNGSYTAEQMTAVFAEASEPAHI